MHRKHPSFVQTAGLPSCTILIGWTHWGAFGHSALRGANWLEVAGGLIAVLLSAFLLGPRTWRAYLLLVIASSGAGLVMAEVALRATVASDFASLYRLDGKYLFAYRPGATRNYHRSAVNGGESIRVHIDRSGFRGAELSSHPVGTRRVVVYGDSFIAAEFSTEPNSYTGQLTKILTDEYHAPVEVVNAGVSGYGPDQASLRMEEEIPRLHPDLVVLCLFSGNDFGDLLRNKLYRLGPRGELERSPAVISSTLRRDFLFGRYAPIVVKLFRRAVDRIESPGSRPGVDEAGFSTADTGSSLTDWWLHDRATEYQNYIVDGDLVVRNLLMDTYDADVAIAPTSPSAAYKLELMERVIAHVDGIARAQRVPLFLVIIPAAEDVVPGYQWQVDSASYSGYRRSTLTDDLDRIASTDGIPHLDLFAPFWRQGASTLYFRRDNDHWNDAGQRLAAKLTVSALEAQCVWPAGAKDARPERASIAGSARKALRLVLGSTRPHTVAPHRRRVNRTASNSRES